MEGGSRTARLKAYLCLFFGLVGFKFLERFLGLLKLPTQEGELLGVLLAFLRQAGEDS